MSPYTKINLRSESEAAWLAGLFDGEACLTIVANDKQNAKTLRPMIQIEMNDFSVIVHAWNLLGKHVKIGNRKREAHHQIIYRISYAGEYAAKIARAIYPWLIAKQKQAALIHTLQLYKKKHIKLTDEQALSIMDVCQRLNQRESVDLPKWTHAPFGFSLPD